MAFAAIGSKDKSFPSDTVYGNEVLQLSAASGTFRACGSSATRSVRWSSSESSVRPNSNNLVSLGTDGNSFNRLSIRYVRAAAGSTISSGYNFQASTDAIWSTVGSNGGLKFVCSGDIRFRLSNDSAANDGLALLGYGLTAAGTPADQSCLLELRGDKGLLLPRMTAANVPSVPADGLVIYLLDTDATFTSVGVWARESGTWIKL